MTKFNKNDFKVGQEVVVAIVTRMNNPLENYDIREVTKLGRKFVYVDGRKYDFNGEEINEYGGYNNLLFLSVEDFEKAKLYQDVLSKAGDFFNGWNANAKHLTVEELQVLSEMMSNAEKRRKEELEKKNQA